MARVYGTEIHDDLHWLFDGVTNGDDIIFGLGGGDWIEGLDGNDIIMGGEGADTLKGGDGTDTATYMDSPEGVKVNLATGEGHGGTAEGDHLDSIENLTGSFYNDFLQGDDHDNVLSGGWGDDYLVGGAGADTLNGGWGDDSAYYTESTTGVTVYLLTNFASGGDAEGDKLNSIENVYGSGYDDILIGDNGANTLMGLDGDDTIFGLDDDDFLYGGVGSDKLYGGSGNDKLSAGPNGDTLEGGSGADTFFWSGNDSGGVLPSGEVDWANMDVVLDFNPGEDMIDVGTADANTDNPYGGPTNTDAFTFIGEYYAAGGFTAPGQVAYGSDGTDTYLMFNTDGIFTVNGGIPGFEFAIRFSGLYTPDASWFVNL
jgi:Ca2+-binding RTX toxin-like protein